MTLILDPGSTTSNSYISLEEAEQIIQASGLSTPLWASLNTGRGLRVTGTISEPFLPLTDICDTISLTVGEGTTQTIVFPESETALTAAETCVFLNQHLTGVTVTPTITNKLCFTVTDPSSSLTIESTDKSAYSIFGLVAGTYMDTVPTTKEYLLRLSAQLLGYMPLYGMRVFRNQALDFPRQPLPDTRGYTSYEYLDRSTAPEELCVIPDEVKEAQALLTCLVVLPNFAEQVSMSESVSLPAAIQNAIVNQVQVANVLTVKATASSSSSSTESQGGSNRMSALANVFTLPVYLLMKKYIAQFKGGALASPLQYDSLLYDEVIAAIIEIPEGD